MKPIDIVFRPAHRNALPASVAKRIPILVAMDVLLIFYFTTASVVRYLAEPESTRIFLVAVAISNLLFVASLVLVRVAHYHPAALVAGVAVLAQLSWLTFLIPVSSVQDIYRFMVYLIASAIANNMVSLDKRQMPLYFVAGLVVFITSVIVVYIPAAGGFTPELRTSSFMLLLIYCASNIAIHYTGSLSRELQSLAEAETKENEAKILALSRMWESSKGSMEVGRNLLSASEDSLARGISIRGALHELDTVAANLSSDTQVAQHSNESILGYARSMHQNVLKQNALVESTSGAIAEMNTTLGNTVALAKNRLEAMRGVLSGVQAQDEELKKVMASFVRIQQTATQVIETAEGILDISQKTDLLAMNASIEAAHAGLSGRGFAVISGEIRKLSDETRVNTNNISTALGENAGAVKSALSVLEMFSGQISRMIDDVKGTFGAFEQIIAGLSEIAVTTRDLSQGADALSALAKETEEAASGVSQRLDEGNRSIAHISSFSRVLKNQSETILKEFSRVEDKLHEIKSSGERNTQEIGALSKELNRIIEHSA